MAGEGGNFENSSLGLLKRRHMWGEWAGMAACIRVKVLRTSTKCAHALHNYPAQVDEEASIRANTTVLLGNLAPNLSGVCTGSLQVLSVWCSWHGVQLHTGAQVELPTLAATAAHCSLLPRTTPPAPHFNPTPPP